NKATYIYGETVVQSGVGFQQGETVKRVLHDGIHADQTLTTVAGGSGGSFSIGDFSSTGTSTDTLTAPGQSSGHVATTTIAVANIAGNIDQGSNGRASAPTNPVDWVNGDLNPQNTHLVEGYSVPYRVVVTGLTNGTNYEIVLGMDTRDQGLAAL